MYAILTIIPLLFNRIKQLSFFYNHIYLNNNKNECNAFRSHNLTINDYRRVMRVIQKYRNTDTYAINTKFALNDEKVLINNAKQLFYLFLKPV